MRPPEQEVYAKHISLVRKTVGTYLLNVVYEVPSSSSDCSQHIQCAEVSFIVEVCFGRDDAGSKK